MNQIKLNNATFDVVNFNRSTNFTGDKMVSNGFCSIRTTEMDTLNELAKYPITSIQIYHDEELIYQANNLNGKIVAIDEILNQNAVAVSVNMTFAPDVEE